MNIVFGSRLEHELLKAEGVPLTYEQKIKGDRMATILIAGTLLLVSIIAGITQV